MGKLRGKRKYLNPVLKALLSFALSQVLICLLFIFVIRTNTPINIDDCEIGNIVVEDVTFRYGGRHARRKMYLISDNVAYYLPSSKEYRPGELKDAIKKGDSLTVIYYDTSHYWSLFEKKCSIVDARDGDTVYLDFDEHVETIRKSRIIGIVAISVLDLIFIGIFVLYVLFCKREIKRYFKEKSKKIKKKMKRAR